MPVKLKHTNFIDDFSARHESYYRTEIVDGRLNAGESTSGSLWLVNMVSPNCAEISIKNAKITNLLRIRVEIHAYYNFYKKLQRQMSTS